MDFGHPIKIKKVQALHYKNCREGIKTPQLIVIDSNAKLSASKV